MNEINTIYSKIKEKLTESHLKKITIQIISLYKNRQLSSLRKYVEIIGENKNIKIQKLFTVLMQKYHPDKLKSIHKKAEMLFYNNDINGINRIHDTYFFNPDSVSRIYEHAELEKPDYRYDKSDFGYKETNINDDDNFGETNLSFEDEEISFTDALKRNFFGGLDHSLSESDLKTIDGDLDLSDFNIEILDGIENCVYLSELDLSGNSIRKIGPLKNLTNLTSLYLSNNDIEDIYPISLLENLRILDISFNDIDDISSLENLDSLEFVNLIGNPVADMGPVEKLIKKGVVVIFEDMILK